MNEFTKEPWRAGRNGTVVADEPVPGMNGSDDVGYYGGHLVAESVTEANARRIVACVNYCAGYVTEGLEMANEIGRPARIVLEQAQSIQLDLIQQRDQLLLAMKEAREEMRIGNFNSASERIKTAIALAEEQS